jgi:hypothetical protein
VPAAARLTLEYFRFSGVLPVVVRAANTSESARVSWACFHARGMRRVTGSAATVPASTPLPLRHCPHSIPHGRKTAWASPP